jgi:Heterokaryon incompatibility protein (HET)
MVAYSTTVSQGTPTGEVQMVPDTDENWILIKKWLRDCQNTHSRCCQLLFDRDLPTRLVDVGENDEHLKLCQTEELPRDTQYCTLSHRWGEEVFTTLTRSNFQDFLSCIPAENLSKTFREAITTTRKLGFRYLWIDSLCIIQGDEADWQQEASKMESVFSNSSLNIAASAAPSGNFGCFTKRSPGDKLGCKVTVQDASDTLHATNVVWDITIKSLLWHLTNGVLKPRAWVFQEIFLAPRTIHFAAQQLLWECASATACETFPDYFDSNTVTTPGVKFDSWNSTAMSVAEKWSAVLADYTGRRVTFREDRLIAVSGVARLFAAKFGTTYLAGLWKEDLVVQLAWSVDVPLPMQPQGHIPSWSWASVDAGSYTQFDSNLDDENHFPLVTILEATAVAIGDEFGDVKEGTIRMKGPLPLTATVTKIFTKTSLGRVVYLEFGLPGYELISSLEPDRTPYSLGEKVYLLPLLRRSDWDGDEIICGLVINSVPPGHYRRTGYFETPSRALEVQSIASYEDEYFVGEALGPNEDGQKMCIITLI